MSMKYYLKIKGERFASEISQKRYYSLSRSNKYQSKSYVQNGQIVGRELIQKD